MIAWTLLFIVCITALVLLPLTPALLEWRNKEDALPLKVVREYDGNIKFFAVRFRQFLTTHFADLMHGTLVASATTTDVSLPGGDACQLVGTPGQATFTPEELTARACARVLLGTASLQLGEDMFFEKEVYASASISGGNSNSFRAILADGNITLGDDCAILRWAHSDSAIALGRRARLYGRISADGEIALHQHSRFGRMQAPLIRFGTIHSPRPYTAPVRTPLAQPQDLIDQTPERWLMSGTLTVPEASEHHTSLVSRKHVTIGAHSLVQGGIKANGDLRVEGYVRIDGPLVASGSLHIGPGCTIKGPVVCEKGIVIEAGTVIGQPGRPTTVTGAEIRIEEGVLAYGSVWARELGFVAPAPATV